jgi:hypothetical protein
VVGNEFKEIENRQNIYRLQILSSSTPAASPYWGLTAMFSSIKIIAVV